MHPITDIYICKGRRSFFLIFRLETPFLCFIQFFCRLGGKTLKEDYFIIPLVVILPLAIGVVTGLLAGVVLRKESGTQLTLIYLMISILLASSLGFLGNYLLPKPVLNFMLIGMAFSATFSNMVTEKRLEQIMKAFNPILGVAMIVVILNLGAPLDYHLILGAGLYTVIYILSRACGKYFGSFFGAAVTKSPKTVRNYLGFTLLPHSGVSLVFTSVAVGVLSSPAPECAQIIQGTIAAAAVINEIIAVIMAKKDLNGQENFIKVKIKLKALLPYERTDTCNN